MNIYFGDRQIIRDSQQIDNLQDATQPIEIDFFMDDLYGYYSLIMYDLDAPYPENNKMSPFIHYLIVNIPGTESTPEAGEIIYKYLPPSPPKSSAPHRYVIDIYQQPGLIDVEPTNSIMHRENFPVDQFAFDGGSVLVDSAMFTFGYQVISPITSSFSARSSPLSVMRTSNNSPSSVISPSIMRRPNNSPASIFNPSVMRTPNNSPASIFSPSIMRTPNNSPGSVFNPSLMRTPNNSPASVFNPSVMRTPNSSPSSVLNPSPIPFPLTPSPTSSSSPSSTIASSLTTPRSKILSFPKHDWFKANTNLSDDEQKYCRCTIKAASKQPDTCLVERAWYQTRDGQTCANPYAVCAKSVGVSTKECGDNYNFESMPDHYLRTYILMMYNSMIRKGVIIPSYTNKEGVTLPIELDRQQMLEIINQYKTMY